MIELILVLALLGLACYVVTAYVSMPEPMKVVIYGVVAIAVVVILVRAFGLDVAVPRIR